jgi:transposase
MNAQGYIDHILPILNEFYEQNPEKMLVEDNATPHAAISSKNSRSTRSWILIEWPPNSPDLNPIESIWRRIKQKIYNGRHLPPKNIAQLRAAVVRAWLEIPDAEIIAASQSMPWRIHECLQRNGGITHW